MKNILKISDYIKIYDLDIDSNILEIIKQREYYMEPAMTRGGDVNYRNCFQFWINEFFIQNIENSKEMIFLYSSLEKILEDSLNLYKKDFPDVATVLEGRHSGFHILKYYVNGKYDRHIDDFKLDAFRRLSISINLNNDYSGGEFKFFDSYTVPLKKNQVIIFPSSWQFPHQILPVTSGERYSIVSWLI